MARPSLEALLIRHEALRLRAYYDTRGKITIGVGRNLEDAGISEAEALFMLDNDIARVVREARTFPWFDSLTLNRQDVVLSMIFNLGLEGFREFVKLQAALKAGDYEAAAREMFASAWAKQLGDGPGGRRDRVEELAEMMRNG